MGDNYLIPANSKRSQLIFGIFKVPDLIIFGSGLGVTFLLLMILPIEQIGFAILAIAPALVTGFLILPIPNYHNMLTIIKSMFKFYTNRQKYLWKGWDYKDEWK